MPSATEGLLPLGPAGLPAWCDPYLPKADTDALGGRDWYDATLAHAVPAGTTPLLAGEGGPVILPLLRQGGRLRGLTTPYSLDWRPLVAEGADGAALRAAGLLLGRHLRGGAPAVLDALSPEMPHLDAFLDGLRAAGLAVLPHDHFGNWHEPLDPGGGWDGYLAARPSVLRATIRRKTARCMRRLHLETAEWPGEALEAAIAAYEMVRGRSWKPQEPAPGFDGALMRAMAASGTLRLGVLRTADGVPVTAQYWAVSGGRAVVLKLAYDEEWRAESPGTVLTALMLTGILGAGGVSELDFGRGDDPYKRLWAGQRRQRQGATLADPRHPAGLLAIARHAAGRGMRAWRALKAGNRLPDDATEKSA